MKPLGLGWPNLVSVSRVLLVPVLVALILAETRTASYVAAAVFAVGGLTDALDGYLARRHAIVTATGIWLDPLSDKIFVAAPIVAMAAIGAFPLWAGVVIIVREVVISILRAYLGARHTSMPASTMAKAKTATQLAAIALYLLPLSEAARGLRAAVLLAAVVLTVLSGLEYVVRMRPVREPRV